MEMGMTFLGYLLKIGLPTYLLSRLFIRTDDMRKLFLSCGLYKERRIYVQSGKNSAYKTVKDTPRIVESKNTEYGYKRILEVLSGMCVDDFIAKRKPIEEYLDATVEFRFLGDRRIEMEVITRKLPSVVNFELIPSASILDIPIGVTRKGTAMIKLTGSFSNILMGGIIGSGKSSLIRSILCYLILETIPKFKHLEIFLVDLKMGVEFGVFKNCRYVTQYANDVFPAFDLLEKVESIIKDRGALYEKLGVANIEKYNQKYGETLGYHNYIVVALDEIANMTNTGNSKNDAYANDLLSYIGRTGRAFGIRCIAATQRPDAKTVCGGIKNNYNTKICLLVADKVNSEIILDEAGGEKLKGNGHGILKMEHKEEFQAFWLDEDDVPKLIEHTYEDKLVKETEMIGVIPFGADGKRQESPGTDSGVQHNNLESGVEASTILRFEETKGHSKKKNGKTRGGKSLQKG